MAENNNNSIAAWTQDEKGNFVVALRDGTTLLFDKEGMKGTPLTDKDFLTKNGGGKKSPT